tara:strand:- start:311 stop:631 length:321 start_codon:yes stop_codon:yes gene_type:complete
MYYLDEIMDRAVDSWSTMLGANDFSFWASSEIEMKPTHSSPAPAETYETETTTSSPAETPAWEPADTTLWRAETSVAATPMIQDIADTVKDVVDEINPFTDSDHNG